MISTQGNPSGLNCHLNKMYFQMSIKSENIVQVYVVDPLPRLSHTFDFTDIQQNGIDVANSDECKRYGQTLFRCLFKNGELSKAVFDNMKDDDFFILGL